MMINQIQDEIVEEFATLNGDVELIIYHIVSLGKILPVMPEKLKVDENLIKGCHSKVWVAEAGLTHRVHFYADSDTIISKGLVSLLLRVFNGQDRSQILNSDLYFIKQSYLERFIGTKRSNGFLSMVDQIRYCVSNFPAASAL